ncbi:substrate-binding domain-containing protein [Microbispora sp. H10830]|uniref:substrate-binding domain-containing protein n=1 Tax=Microbispora sp. H10830 TaxID=2729109 RepID=UPI0016020544|nr:substrate-binding domain-containing protein [Microbispora sp. H10830]
MPSGRHRAAFAVERRRRQARWKGVVAALAAVAIVAAGGVLFLTRSTGTCSARDPILVSVAAAVDVAPPVMDAAERFNASGAGVEGRCVQVQVAEQPPAPVLRTLIGDRAGVLPDRPDGWIADSSVWVRLARKQGGQDIAADETVVATSPLVFATRRSLAERFAAGGTAMSWDMVFPATVRGRLQPTEHEPDIVRIPDPSVSGAGIATVAAARDIVGTGEKADRDLTAFVRMAQSGSAPDYRSMLGAVDAPGFWSRPVVIVPEQSVWAHNRGSGAEPVVALQPKEGTINLDYPYVVTAADPDRAAASRLFAAWLRSAATQEAVRKAGFRGADGQPPFDSGAGISTELPRPRPSITAEVIDEALEAWSRLAPPSRLLVLADVSKENAEPIDGPKGAGGKTRLDVAVEAAKLGLQLFPNETHMGLWEFARDLKDGADHRELVGLGPITKPDDGQEEIRRTALFRVADGIKALGDRGSSLYDAIDAGFRSVSKGYDPLMSNALLVLTAGVDDGKGVSRRDLVDKLRKEWDPDKPVQIIVVAFGKAADRQALGEIVSATNGQLYVAQEPGQIIDVFLSALARRLCHPTCSNR